MAKSEKFLDPQKENFLLFYTDPKSETFANACKSALKAGYSESYAENITTLMPDWLLENIGDMKRLRRAEKNLDEVQELSIFDNETGKVDSQVLDKRIKVDLFFAKTLNKNKYSERSELTGANGDALKLIVDDTERETNIEPVA